MRFESIHIKDLGPFTEVHLDLSAIAGKLIAVTGDNGAGKSTLLELLPAALYRDCPTRGSLSALATSRNAFVEVRAVNGSSYTLRQSADAISKKSEALILNAAGEPLLESGKVRDSDAFVASHFVPADVLYSSSFMSQASQGFLDLTPADRKRVLLRLLGIERLEALADGARERARQSKNLLETSRARIEDASRRCPDLAQSEVDHAAALERVSECEAAIGAARVRVEQCLEARAREEQSAQKRARRARLVTELESSRATEADLTQRMDNNRGLLARRAEILDAVVRRDTQSAELTALVEQYGQADAALKATLIAEQTARDALKRAQNRLQRAQSEELEARECLKARAEVEEAAAALPEARAALAASIAAADVAEAVIKDAELALRSQKDVRIKRLRGGLTTIASKPVDAKTIARSTLTADDQLQADADPKALTALRGKLTKLRTGVEEARERVEQLQATAAGAKEIKRADKALALALAEVAEAETERAAAKKASADHLQALKRLRPETADLFHRADLCRLLLGGAEQTAALLPKLEAAEARLEELEPQLARLLAARAQSEAELATLPVEPVAVVDLAGAQLAVKHAESAEREARGRLGTCVERLKAAREGQDARASLEVERSAHDADLSNWTRLGQDLGKDGLQALEIDAAIPELNTLANDLLHSCHGSRFTVEVRTDRLSSDGKRTLEDLDVRVVDTEHGRDAAVESFSGGERVVVGEALSLALTMLACRRAGLERPTLVRDETGAALDPLNGRAYIAMLRRAAAHLDCDKVLFVTHSPELQALADARIVVSDGSAVVQA